MLTYEQARRTVINQVEKARGPRASVNLSVWDALGFVLAEEIKTDREYPPFDRSTRDGYAVRAAEFAPVARLRCVAEIKAGDTVTQPLTPRTCAQIMTGAAVPPGADAVVMIEQTSREGDSVRFERAAQPGQNIVPRGSEAKRGETILSTGMRLGYAELALAAQVGATQLRCASKPRVAILSTGDEVVLIDQQPGAFQIRNSNSVSLAAQVRLAGGEPVLLGNAADRVDDLRDKITRALREDILVLSGGVSMGKYDLVEAVLKDLGAQFFFDAVAIRPGRPAVFGKCGETFVFGLPGNPVSTMVTFELFVGPAIDLLSGAPARDLPLVEARLAEALNEKPGLTHFLPARVAWRNATPEVKALPWQGSGDIAALARANCFLVVAADRGQVNVGETMPILLRKDII
ncbi:MAG TPA: gephyrin-like molybdotransferase Glp [Candidatus Acidoferrum sp.]